MSERVTFRAYFPPIQSAIKIHGTDGIRLTLDVSETDLAEALRLLIWRNEVLRVTVELGDQQGVGYAESV